MNEQTAAAQLAGLAAGRLASVTQNVVQLTAGDNALLSPSTKRRAILIMPPSWGRVWLSADVPSALGVGIPVDADAPPLLLTDEDVGDMVHRGFRAWHSMLDVGGSALPCASRGGQAVFVTNAIATVTAPAVPGQCVVVEGGSAAYVPNAGSLITINFGATIVGYWTFSGAAQVVLQRPLVAPVNTPVSFVLPAGGAGVSAFMTMNYTMIPSPTITVYEVIGP